VAHIALGAIQFEKSPIYVTVLYGGAALVSGLHIITALATLRPARKSDEEGWIKVAAFAEMINFRAKTVRPISGEAIAVFRNNNEVVAVSNICRHQGGPLGEGRIVNGEITCPWHGFQYRPGDGCSPAPFTEKIATYATKIDDGVVYVSITANPPGTPQRPSTAGDTT
jgi:nitrite reductase/ring-hydroxylating ferredoxin subunit